MYDEAGKNASLVQSFIWITLVYKKEGYLSQVAYFYHLTC